MQNVECVFSAKGSDPFAHRSALAADGFTHETCVMR